MSSTFPTHLHLVTALVATLAVTAASFILFYNPARAVITPSLAVLGPTWCLFLVTLNIGTAIVEGIKAITGCGVGVGFGCVAFALSHVCAVDPAIKPMIATLISIPVGILFMYADPTVNAPLRKFMRQDVALLGLYAVTMSSSGYTAAVPLLVSFLISAGFTMVFVSICCIFYRQGCVFVQYEQVLDNFLTVQANWKEGLTTFMTFGSHMHLAELDARQAKATSLFLQAERVLNSLNNDAFVEIDSPESLHELQTIMTLMHCQLLAFRQTYRDGYTEDALRAMWDHVRDKFGDVRMSTLLILRPTTTPDYVNIACDQVMISIQSLYNQFIETACDVVAKRRKDLPIGHDIVRLSFAIMTLIRFSLLAVEFRTLYSNSVHVRVTVLGWTCNFRNSVHTLFSKAGWAKSSINHKHVFRAVAAQQIAAQCLLIVALYYPTQISEYVMWGLWPVIFCFLHTLGGSLVKGSRRLIGTLLGAGIGCITAVANPSDDSAYFVELLIITYIAKLSSLHPAVDYAGLVFGFTWYIVSLPNIGSHSTESLLLISSYRIVLTTVGIVAGSILSAVLFPTLAGTILRQLTCKSLMSVVTLVNSSIELVMDRTVEDASYPTTVSETVDVLRGAAKRSFQSLYEIGQRRHAIAIDAAAEAFFIRRHIDTNVVSLHRILRAEASIDKVVNAAYVVIATAAATHLDSVTNKLFIDTRVRESMMRLSNSLSSAALPLTHAISCQSEALDADCILVNRMAKVDRAILKRRLALGETGELDRVVRGGGTRLYVFDFALREFFISWDEMVDALRGIPSRDSCLFSLETQNDTASSSGRNVIDVQLVAGNTASSIEMDMQP